MKIQDLRLGNLVLFNGEQYLVSGLILPSFNGEGSINLLKGDKSITVLLKDIQPIIISESILKERLQFEEDDNYGFPILSNKALRMDAYESGEGWHLHIDDSDYCTTFSGVIRYLHELQNTFYLSTREELSI